MRGVRRGRQRSVRALLILVFVPVVIVVGLLASAVLASGRCDAAAAVSGMLSGSAPAPAAVPDEPPLAVDSRRTPSCPRTRLRRLRRLVGGIGDATDARRRRASERCLAATTIPREGP